MSVTSDQQFTSPVDGFSEPSIGDFWALLKPRVMSLVIFTGFAGMYLAPGTLHPLVFVVSLFAIAAGAGASGAINQWYDRDIDAVMSRTKTRPIPAGVMIPAEALTMGLVISALSGIATWACGELACGKSACFHNLSSMRLFTQSG
jgi:protoheme IX farnesyltransferase